ncbi:MAG: glycosyltransferase family 2 protein [Rhodopila sp.]|nr:glycosyltransferase family 2 protein [Rhodopila sp.]
MSATLEMPPVTIRDRGWLSDKSIAEQFGLVPNQPRVAVLIPCRNEEAAIGKVVSDFQRSLPDAIIYVYDNNSTDHTMLEARAAGAVVRRERLQGKGHVVRRMFADIDADVYILVDGDDTYDPSAAPGMLNLLVERQLDMVSAARYGAVRSAYRPGHRLGNALLTGLVTWAFGEGITDMLSGYRVFSRRFVKSFPALSSGFETETEFTVHALALHMPVQEVRAHYRNRAAGTRSKLNTLVDGMRILRAIVTLIQQERPLQVFSIAALALLTSGISLGVPVVIAFLHTGLVPRLPTAVLSTGLVLLAFLSLACGLILDAVSRGRKENKRLAYLAIPPLECPE